MSKQLEVREVRLLGEEADWAWQFRRGVNVIFGPVGTGKTTLLNLIRFGLGGTWTPTKKARESAHGVDLALRIDATELRITRGFGKNRVIASVGDSDPDELPLARRKGRDEKTLSDVLLELLDIPRVRVPSSRARPGKKQTTVSFQDVMTHLYLEQTEIDRSTAHSEDKVLGPKRQYVFELLYGLLDERLARLQRETGERADETRQLRADRKLLAGWASSYRTELSKVLRTEAATQDVAQLGNELGTVERHIAEQEASEAPVRDELERLDAEVAAAKRTLADAQRELERLRGVHAQLELDLERLGRAGEATARFQAFEYVICPRCLQDLQAAHPDAHCRLCGQVDVQEPSPVAIETERTRRTEQLEETEILERDAETEIETIAATIGAAQYRRESLSAQLAAQGEGLQRNREERTALLVKRAQAQSQIQLAGALPQPEFLVDELDHRLTTVAQDQSRIERESREHQHQIAPRRQELSELSSIFSEILQVLDLPWFEGQAFIEADTYLPIVDGQTLPELSSGGMKATVNLAYYLSHLVFALREPTAVTPRFLMIDGLRKDFGAGAKDLARADMIYRVLLTQQDAMKGPPPRHFQMLVVDNDLPAGVGERVHRIELDYETPLISDESLTRRRPPP
jgi:hypothetical protein